MSHKSRVDELVTRALFEAITDSETDSKDEVVTYRYINFTKSGDTGKTMIWSCKNNKSGAELGVVKWFPSWRQYCFFPTTQIVLSSGCLQDIRDFIDQKLH